MGRVLGVGLPLVAGLLVLSPGIAQAASDAAGLAKGPGGSPDMPLSGSSCDQSVCIALTGSGTHVSDWSTSATASQATCTHANYLDNNAVIATGPEYCGGPDTTYDSDWPSPGSFASGTVLCNTWAGISGRACVTISG